MEMNVSKINLPRISRHLTAGKIMMDQHQTGVCAIFPIVG
jgi:hypothetical protein